MLSLRGIAKSYGATRALRDVTLEIAAGEAVLLVGRNGAGKTTLLRIVTGFLDADAGTVRADGRIGYLPEHAPAPVELTVRDHLRFRARLKRATSESIDRAMAAVEIADRASAPIGTLSKGYRQRVGLADALLGEPPLLVLDEPTSGMDPIQTKELCDRLIELARSRAVLVSSHAVADLEAFAQRVIVLRDGAVVADGPPSTICARAGKAELPAAVITLLEGA